LKKLQKIVYTTPEAGPDGRFGGIVPREKGLKMAVFGCFGVKFIVFRRACALINPKRGEEREERVDQAKEAGERLW
jgi:hypothetical protein